MNLPIVSRKEKKSAKRDKETYPPRIVLTISEIEDVPFRTSARRLQCHVTVTGIAEQRSVCQGFNLPILHRVKRGKVCNIIKLQKIYPMGAPTETINIIQAAVDPPGGPGK